MKLGAVVLRGFDGSPETASTSPCKTHILTSNGQARVNYSAGDMPHGSIVNISLARTERANGTVHNACKEPCRRLDRIADHDRRHQSLRFPVGPCDILPRDVDDGRGLRLPPQPARPDLNGCCAT